MSRLYRFTWCKLSILFILILLFSLISQEVWSETPLTVSGRVTDINGTTGLSGVCVTVFSDQCHQNELKTSNTDENGYYTLTIPSDSPVYIFANGDCIPDNKYTQLWYDGGNGSFNCHDAIHVPAGGIANFRLSPAGFIEGFVYHQDGKTPVSGVCINVTSASPPDWNGVAGTCYTDANGYYLIHGVPAGNLFVITEGNTDQNGLSLVNEWYGGTNSTRDPNQAQSVTINANQTTSNINFQLDLGGTLSGTVYELDGETPIKGVHVYVQSDACGGTWYGGANTDATGKYTIKGIPAGAINIRACPTCSNQDYVDEWYDGSNGTNDCNQAADIQVVKGQEVSDIDFKLAIGATITGIVYQEDGVTPYDQPVNVTVYQGDPCGHINHITSATIDPATGAFLIRGIPAGQYYLRLENHNQIDTILKWWNSTGGSQTCSHASSVTVSEGQSLSGYFFIAQPGETISGTIFESDGETPIEGVHVQVFSNPCGGTWYGGANTDAAGNYTIKGIPAGPVSIRACPTCNSQDYVDEWYDGSNGTYDCNQAADIQVVKGQEVLDIDFKLAIGATITGIVYQEDGVTPYDQPVNVTVYQGDPCGHINHITSATIDPATGAFLIRGVPAGQYYLRIENHNQINALRKWWNSTGGSLDCSQAEPVTILEGQPLSGLIIKTGAGGLISGTVTESNGVNPIEGVHVYVQSENCNGTWQGGTNTDSSGKYTITGIPEGNVIVRACPTCSNQEYVDEWFNGSNGTSDCNKAVPVQANANQETGKINFKLDLAGTITGTVYESDGETPIEGVHVYVQSDACGGAWLGGSHSDTQGNYTIKGIPAGSVNVRACPTCSSKNYIDEWYDGNNGTRDCNQATDIQVVAEETTPGIDFQLDVGGAITGTVLDGDGQPVENFKIQVWSGKCWNNHLGEIRTDENGYYEIKSLPAGEVYVRTCADCDKKNYIDLWWDSGTGTTDCNLASPVTVLSGGQTDNVDFTLSKGPKRVEWSEVAVYNGKLGAGFDVLPGFNHMVKGALLEGPNGFTHTFDLKNDVLDWFNECNYLVAWWHEFAETFDYGEYRVTITFKDGAQETYTHNLVQVALTRVNVETMSHTVNPDGSIDFAWTNPDPTQRCHVRIYQNGERVYRSNYILNMETLHVSAQDLKCVIQGGGAVWEVRVSDDNQPYNAVQKSGQLPLNYAVPGLENRIWWFEATKVQGVGAEPMDTLNLYFDTRPGSRDQIHSARVNGPEGFTPYTFDLINDWYSISTETRKNSGWFKKIHPLGSILDGTYTLTVEFKDGYVETRQFTLSADLLTPVDKSTMGYEIYENGSIRFFWDLPSGVTGQNYSVRIRNEQGSLEFVSYGTGMDTNQVLVSAWALRALPHGGTFRWFMRSYDSAYDTMVQSDHLDFFYDPFGVFLKGDINHDGIINFEDGILSLLLMTNTQTPTEIYKRFDVNKDGKIGLEEAINALQVISEKRSK